MRRILFTCALAAAAGVGAAAQDSTTRSTTRVEASDGKAVSMEGCLQRDAAGHFTLVGIIAKGEEITTRSKVETDVDDNRARTRASTETEVEDGRVGTSGRLSTFMLTPRAAVNLTPHVGQRVQISAVKVDRDEKDAEVKIEEKTEVDPDRGDDSRSRTRTEIEVDRGAPGDYTVVSVKGLGSSC